MFKQDTSTMKNLLIATLFVFTVLTGCKDDAPVDTTDTTSGGDIRENVLGKYTCNWELFNAVTGVESGDGTFVCEIWANTDDATKFDFRIDGLTKPFCGTRSSNLGTEE